MKKRIVIFVCGFSCIWSMNAPTAQVDEVQQRVMTAYHILIVPHIEYLKLLRVQLENDFLVHNIHGSFRTLCAIRHAGFRLIRAYHRFDIQMQQQKILRSSCTPVRQLLTNFAFGFVSWMSGQLDEFFSTCELSDIFVAEQIDWTESFFALEMLLVEHGRAEKSSIIEEEPCAGTDLIEYRNEPADLRKRLCCCLFK